MNNHNGNHRTEFIFSGFGGQGVMFVGQLLAYAAMDAGFNVTWIPSYGPEMRGGTAHCTTIVSERTIGSPISPRPHVAVVMNTPSFTKYESLVRPDGLLVVNTALVSGTSRREDIEVLDIPATTMAEALGNVRAANMVLLGAALTARPALPLAVLHTALEAHLPAHHRNVLAINHAALDAGEAAVLAVRKQHPSG
ncbi:MAG: 2-oxoacid:acceptor oxidoreductase family protein [Chloroflexi bacterium]|nr:2-oxoacid:acceptor oxidoreductase family protein [Chloroflexota bacterium]